MEKELVLENKNLIEMSKNDLVNFFESDKEEFMRMLVEDVHKVIDVKVENYINKYKSICDMGIVDKLYRIAMYGNKTARGGVYVVKNKLNNKYKIGSTADFENRIKQLKTAFIHVGMESDLEIVRLIYCFDDIARKLEHEIHDKLQEYRSIGEWFIIEDDKILSDMIKEDQLDFGGYGIYINDKFMKNAPEKINIPKAYILLHELFNNLLQSWDFTDKDLEGFVILMKCFDCDEHLLPSLDLSLLMSDIKNTPLPIAVINIAEEGVIIKMENDDIYKVGDKDAYETCTYGQHLYSGLVGGVLDGYDLVYAMEDLYDVK